MMNQEVIISPQQSRVERARLGWTQKDLAEKAQLGQSTVADFERGYRISSPETLEAIKKAFEADPLFKAQKKEPIKNETQNHTGTLFRRVDATDLSQWAERDKPKRILPELTARLIRLEVGLAANLLFPDGESIYLSGWDGWCNSEKETKYIPLGNSFWELSTEKDVLGKADRDYKKRTKNTDELKKRDSVFIFLTPRRCKNKKKWVEEKNKEGEWKEVRAYNADDLVHWIDLHPTIGIWLSIQMNKLPKDGFMLLEEAWKQWSEVTNPHLTSELMLSGTKRDNESIKITKWLKEGPSSCFVEAESSNEAISFLYATIQRLPKEERDLYIAQILIVKNNETARLFINSIKPFIIISIDTEPSLIQRLVGRGHYVYAVYNQKITGADKNPNFIKLPKPLRHELESSLFEMLSKKENKKTNDIEEEIKKKARKWALESGQSLVVLRQILLSNEFPSTLPEWADSKFKQSLITALLVGGWNENNEEDKSILEFLSGQSYSSFIAEIQDVYQKTNIPMQKLGSEWKISAHLQTWLMIAGRITLPEFKRFLEVALKVFQTKNHRYSLKPNERWIENPFKKIPEHSKILRKGLAESLILFSVYGDKASVLTNTSEKIDELIRKIFENADSQLWWSLHEDFELLAEASPRSFSTGIEKSLDQKDAPVLVLLNEDKGFWGREYLSGLLCALEALAWDSKYLSQTVKILTRLASKDHESNYADRPKNSLKKIFSLNSPQTYANLDTRLKILSLIQKDYPEIVWNLTLELLRSGQDYHNAHQFLWRPISDKEKEPITNTLIFHGVEKLSELLLNNVGTNLNHWKDLLDQFPHFLPDSRKKIIDKFLGIIPQIHDQKIRLEIWNMLREFLHEHRSFPEAKWKLSSDELNKIEEVYISLTPNNIFDKFSWLFANNYIHLTNPFKRNDWKAHDNEINHLRKEALIQIKKEKGIQGIFDFAKDEHVQIPIGAILTEINLGKDDTEAILKQATAEDGWKYEKVGYSFIYTLSRKLDPSWAHDLLKKACDNHWGKNVIIRILIALPVEKSIWEKAKELGEDVEEKYWKQVDTRFIKGDIDETSYVINKLLLADRILDALEITEHHLNKPLPNKLIYQVLQKAALLSTKNFKVNDWSTYEYIVEKLFNHLYVSKDIPENEMAELEFIHLRFLTHSSKKPRYLHKMLAKNPSFFLEVLSKIFTSEKEKNEKECSKNDQQITSLAFDLLQNWNRIPGTQDDGSFNPEELEKWVNEARILCEKEGYKEIGDQKIGEILAHSPKDADGIWPSLPIRNLIENIASQDLETGIYIGYVNSRGITSRGSFDGGEKERIKAEDFHKLSKATQIEWPRTSALLENIAHDYERQAKWLDAQIEKM